MILPPPGEMHEPGRDGLRSQLVGAARQTVAVGEVAQVGVELAERLRSEHGPMSATLLWAYDLPDGDRAFIYQMLFDNARLCIGPPDHYSYRRGYCYRGMAAAILYAAKWIVDGATGEPSGWVKNLQTGETVGDE